MELNNFQEQCKELEKEVKKLNRQLLQASNTIERIRVSSIAQDNLSDILSAEKTKQEKYLSLLLENSSDITILVDANKKVIFCSHIFLKYANIANFGLIKDISLVDIFIKLCPTEWLEKANSFLDDAFTNKRSNSFPAEIDFGADTGLKKFDINSVYIDGEETCVLIIFHDITDITKEKDRAEHANSAKSDFLATISHEIRTPMNAVMGLSEMLKKTNLNETQFGYLVKIQNSSTILLSLINDILDFSKIESGKLELIKEPFDLYNSLGRLKSIFEVLFTQKNLEFICDFSDSLNRVVYDDEKRVIQVITNILNNALKYTGSGFVRFSVYLENELTVFKVTDSGIGIHEEDMSRLFDAFEQLDKVRNKNIVGTGLGLAITDKICKLFGGSIEVDSVYNKGSTFTIKLPLIPGELEEDAAMGKTLEFKAPNAKILIVDDIEINLLVASSMLEIFDVVSETASSGYEAINLIEKNDYDLVFMDHMMPGMDGIETVRRIRETEKGKLIPIVALTANAVNGMEKMFYENGFDGFITKPIAFDAFSNSLYKLLPKKLIVEVIDC